MLSAMIVTTGFKSSGISVTLDKSVNIWATNVLPTYTHKHIHTHVYTKPHEHAHVYIHTHKHTQHTRAHTQEHTQFCVFTCLLFSFPITDLNVSFMRLAQQ